MVMSHPDYFLKLLSSLVDQYPGFIKYPLLLLLIFSSCTQKGKEMGLDISENGHYLVDQKGAPFYWIGDTGWAMFQKLTREEVNQYLDDRKNKGFTIIQAVLFWFPHNGIAPNGPLHAPNIYGHRPFKGSDQLPVTDQPNTLQGGNADHPNDYWDHADYIIQAAKERGLYLVLLPCWGNAFINNRMPGSEIVFTEEQARAYGRFLGERYGNEKHIIWCLGGDVDPVNFGDRDQRMVYRAMAEGLARGSTQNDQLKWNEDHPDWDQILMTFHAVRTPRLSGPGAEGGSSSLWFHNEPWIDFNMMETFKWMDRIYGYVQEDYHKLPVKPTVLGEGAYEGGKYGNPCGWVTLQKIRQQGFHAFFAGAAGYTYGHWAIWPFEGEHCGRDWKSALNAPGAENIGAVFLNLIKERHLFSMVPDPNVIASDSEGGRPAICAMSAADYSKVLVYVPDSSDVTIAADILNKMGAKSFIWFDPRTGAEVKINEKKEPVYTPPAGWEDAVLIIKRIE